MGGEAKDRHSGNVTVLCTEPGLCWTLKELACTYGGYPPRFHTGTSAAKGGTPGFCGLICTVGVRLGRPARLIASASWATEGRIGL
jgi:hypothetical protein